MNKDEVIMQLCIRLAKKGAGFVSPNPLVGAVIVRNGKIISRGYHKKFGLPHAEIEAISNAKNKGKSLKGASLYVNLEPCCHYAKTPPCTDEIISSGIRKVVIGIRDPYKKVAGRGIKKLREAGIEVLENILKDECLEVNKFFLKYVTTGMPYVMLKIAQTLDGKIADKNYRSRWITGIESRKQVHKLRSEYDAVLIGKNTLMYDNPSLTVRSVKGRDPHRIILDPLLEGKTKSKVYTDKNKNKTIVVTSISKTGKVAKLKKQGVRILQMTKGKSGFDIRELLVKLAAGNFSSIMVEGGGHTFSRFIEAKVVDEILMFVAPKVIGEGIESFRVEKNVSLMLKEISTGNFGDDILVQLKIEN